MTKNSDFNLSLGSTRATLRSSKKGSGVPGAFYEITSYNQGASRPDDTYVVTIRALRALMAVALRATVSGRCTVLRILTHYFLLKISVLAEVKFSIFESQIFFGWRYREMLENRPGKSI